MPYLKKPILCQWEGGPPYYNEPCDRPASHLVLLCFKPIPLPTWKAPDPKAVGACYAIKPCCADHVKDMKHDWDGVRPLPKNWPNQDNDHDNQDD